MNNFYVYLYLRNKNSKHGLKGTPYYIGKGFGNRCFKKHQKGISVPKNKNFIKFHSVGLTEEDAFRDEIFLIDWYGRVDLGTGCLLNKTDGGDGQKGLIHTEGTKNKISKSLQGKLLSETHRKNISKSMKGKNTNPLSEDHKRKIGAGNKGKTVSNESKEKISKSLLGHVVIESTRRKISKARKKNFDVRIRSGS